MPISQSLKTRAKRNKVRITFDNAFGQREVRSSTDVTKEIIKKNTSPAKSPRKSPAKSPTKSPTKSPAKSPTKSPTKSPRKSPTKSPRKSPTKSPRKSPTKSPRKSPTIQLVKSPTKSPIKQALPVSKFHIEEYMRKNGVDIAKASAFYGGIAGLIYHVINRDNLGKEVGQIKQRVAKPLSITAEQWTPTHQRLDEEPPEWKPTNNNFGKR